jgi:hypothetical protein
MPVLAQARRRNGKSGRGRGDALSRCARWLLVPLALSSGALAGCAGWWDEVTSRDFHFKDMFKKAPDPMWVIQNSPDGDKKAKAFRALKEPAQNGGTQQEQDVIVRLLIWTAANDPQAVCRLAAIDTLSRFRDPRVVPGLEDAYEKATGVATANRAAPTDPTQRFPQDTTLIIHSVVLTALGKTGQPAAVPFLAAKLNQPPGDEGSQQLVLDERIAAARALSHFPQYQATEALVKALRTSPDVALRSAAQQSLVQITGKDLPPDAQAWDNFLHQSPNLDAVAGSGNVFDKFLHRITGPTENAESK